MVSVFAGHFSGMHLFKVKDNFQIFGGGRKEKNNSNDNQSVSGVSGGIWARSKWGFPSEFFVSAMFSDTSDHGKMQSGRRG